MKVVRVVPFEFEGEVYETRVLFDGSEYRVMTYKGEALANPYRHGISLDTALEYGAEAALVDLIRQSRELVEEKAWARYQELFLERTGRDEDDEK